MQPIALAFKNYTVNPFTSRGGGELMLIHNCLACGKLSPNRTAGDDNEFQILTILKESMDLHKSITARFRQHGIEPITTSNREDALISLFGINYRKSFGDVEDPA